MTDTNSQKIMNEIGLLADRKRWDIRYDREAQLVVVEGVHLSKQWRPSETAVLLDLPAEYPAQPPRAYIEESIRFVGKRDGGGERPDFVAPHSIREDIKWCPIHVDLEWGADQWLGSVLVHIERVM